MFCTECGHKTESNVRFCANCGKNQDSTQNAQTSDLVIQSDLDDASNKAINDTNSSFAVRQNLKKFTVHTNMTCFECGYSGLMGVTKIIVPWYVSWWFVLPMFFILSLFGIGLIGLIVIGVVFGILRNAVMKKETECPSCNTQLTQRELI